MHAITKTLPAFIVRLENSALGLYGFPQVNTGEIKSTRIDDRSESTKPGK